MYLNRKSYTGFRLVKSGGDSDSGMCVEDIEYDVNGIGLLIRG